MEAVTTVATETVLYLYGFVRPDVNPAVLASGLGDVLVVEDGDVACAASVVAAVDYHVPPDANRPRTARRGFAQGMAESRMDAPCTPRAA